MIKPYKTALSVVLKEAKKNKMKEVYVKDIRNHQEVVDTVNNYGVAIIKDYLVGDDLHALNKEYDEILKTNDVAGIETIAYDKGEARNFLIGKVGEGFEHTKKVFFNDDFRKIKNLVLDEQSTFNSEIFVVKDVVGSKHHANDMHFDVVPTFKFFLYLTDTTIENGAFTCVPGSPKKTRAMRSKYGKKINYKNRYISRELDYTEEEVFPVEGKAGTLIIFTTETFHKAGTVSQGERRVMRGHCRYQKDQNSGGIKAWIKKLLS